MRPLTLRMSGLRSYRSEVTIDFGDPGLIAIVGDTGAGKSSILEALFFVLYGGCTWDHRAVVPLISEGTSVMQVELVFLAENRRWRVFRSASRSAAQSRHELQCLDDPALRFDNDGPVTAEIRRLIGLDSDAFLRTVILPQGRFQMLLQATKTDRTAILKGIFRLDQLAAARDQADSATRRLRPGVENLSLERAALLPDPRAVLADARDRHDQARSRQTILQGLAEKISAATRQRDDATRQAADLEARQRAVRDSVLPTAGDELAALASAADRIDEQRHQLEAERDRYRAEASSLDGLLKRADDNGEGIAGLASAAATIASLADQLPSLAAETARCQQEARDLETLSRTVHDQETNAASLQAQVTDAQGRASQLADAARMAGDQVNQARALLVTARNCAATLTGLREEEHAAGERRSAAAEAIDPAAAQARSATAQRETARSALAAVQRANAAAHAAEGCQPGDPCPICRRPLPPDFGTPVPPGEADARAQQAAAEHAAEEAAAVLAARQADLIGATQALQRASQASREAEERLADALAQLKTALPRATLDDSDEALLAPLTEASRAATAEHDAAAAQATQLANESAGVAATAEALRGQLEQQSDQLRNHQESVRTRQESCENAAAGLPRRFAITVPLAVDALTDMSERIAERRAEVNQTYNQLTQARQAADQIGLDLEALADTLRHEVDEPAQQLLPRLAAAAQRLDDLSALLEIPPAPARASGGLANDAHWANRLREDADLALARAQQVLTELKRQHDQALDAISTAVAVADAVDEAGLQQAIVDVSAALSRAADDIHTATDQIPRAAELDDKIQQAQGLLAALDELARLLSDSKFIAYVVARKQLTLLAIATEVLGSMTAGRYGFSESFEIIDRLTRLPRGVKTLSGGETFLASLALALSLVELAGKGGGRLDALFLDEGFGSLDANSLADALDALGRQAQTGRLVAVISHVRSVAEIMDRVLAVTTGPAGSTARWLGGSERDELIAEDVEASLLT
jgi:exonuclease SbcC